MLKGVLVLTNDAIKFYQKPKSCSFFDELVKIPLSQLKFVRLNMFQHQPKGVIVEDKVNGLFVFSFETPSLRERFADTLQTLNIKIVNGFQKDELAKYTQLWCDNKLSTFEYLLKLNFISGRSWTDFTQFPIFPWTVIDFNCETKPTEFRNLSFPLFAQTEAQRKMCRDYYNGSKEMGGPPHHFPNYISNVGSSLYYLIRLEPFTDEELNFQSGSFDAADRTFQSLGITKDLMFSPSTKSALELVPEIYFVPEIYTNVNKIVLPQSPLTHKDISNVVLPLWAKNSPQKLVKILRKCLESEETSENLNAWIDLVWGVRREGTLAFERCNVLQPIIFSFDPDKYFGDRVMMKAVIDQIHNCGQAPMQLFSEFHPKRGKNLNHYSKLKLIQSTDPPKPINNDSLQFKMLRQDGLHKLLNGYKVRISCTSIEYLKTKQNSITFTFADEIRPICIQTDGNDIVTGHKLPIINHWSSTEIGLKHEATLTGHMDKVTCVSISNHCKLIISGHSDGHISIFALNPHKLLRIISTENNLPVKMIHIIQPTSSFLVFQKGSSQSTLISLFSCNGKKLASVEIEAEIRDCATTTFPEGTQKNYIILITKDKLISLSANTLMIKEIHQIEGYQLLSISIWNKYNIFISTSSNTLVRWFLSP